MTFNQLFYKTLVVLINILYLFGVNLFFARTLGPVDYSSVVILNSILTFTQIFVEGGFRSSVIRSQFFNKYELESLTSYSFIVALIVFFLSLGVTYLFNLIEYGLSLYLVCLFLLNLISNSLGNVAFSLILRSANYKREFLIKLFSITFSVIVCLIIFNEISVSTYGVFILINSSISSLLYLIFVNFKTLGFYLKVSLVKKHVQYGKFLTFSGILNTLTDFLQTITLYKFFPHEILSLFSKGREISELPSKQLATIVGGINYSNLARDINNNDAIKIHFQSNLHFLIFIGSWLFCFFLTFSDHIIFILLGDNWKNTEIFLVIFSFSSFLYPIHSLQLNIIKVYGASKLFFKLDIIKKILYVLFIMSGILFKNAFLLAVLIVLHSLIGFFINSRYVIQKKIILYKNFFQGLVNFGSLGIFLGLFFYFSDNLFYIQDFIKLFILIVFMVFLIIKARVPIFYIQFKKLIKW